MARNTYLYPLRLRWDADSASLTQFLTHVTDAALVGVTTQVVGGQSWAITTIGVGFEVGLAWSLIDENGLELAGGAQLLRSDSPVRTEITSQPIVTAKRLKVRIRFDTPPEFPLTAVPSGVEVLWTGHFATQAVE